MLIEGCPPHSSGDLVPHMTFSKQGYLQHSFCSITEQYRPTHPRPVANWVTRMGYERRYGG